MEHRVHGPYIFSDMCLNAACWDLVMDIVGCILSFIVDCIGHTGLSSPSCLEKLAYEVWSSFLCSHQFYPCHWKFLWQVKVICHFTSLPGSFTAQTSPLMSRWKRSPTFYWFRVKKPAAWSKFYTQQASPCHFTICNDFPKGKIHHIHSYLAMSAL